MKKAKSNYMSFKLFLYQLTGKLKPVETIELRRKNLQNDFRIFTQVENSDELKEFVELEEWVNSEKFRQKKTEIESLSFKGSREYNQQKEFEKLKKTGPIKKYFKVADSSELKRYNQLKDSDKIKEYHASYEYVNEGQFEKDKKEIKSQLFKGSVEEKHLNDFKKLQKSPGIKAWLELNNSEQLKNHKDFGESEKLRTYLTSRNAPEMDKQTKKEFRILKRDREIKAYFRFEHSKKLRLYHETDGSHDLKRYFELKDYVETEEFKKREAFLKDKKKFENSEAFQKYKRFKSLSADADVKFFLRFEKSGILKNYLDVKDSFDLKRYFELEKTIGSEDYKKRKAYLEDKKKWEKTEEFARQQHYLEMKDFPTLVTYFKYKDTNAFDFLRNWEVAFEDNFSDNTLNRDLWQTKGYWAEKLLGENYSLPGDLHVVTDGKNVSVDKKLILEVRKEKSSGKVWKMPAGFVPTEFDYTAGFISTGKSFWIEDGVIEAKIKFNPLKQVVNSFFCAGENNLPRLTLVEMGTKNQMGISVLNKSGKTVLNGISVSNLKKRKWYIFSVERRKNTFTWKINETPVLTLNGQELEKSLHLNASNIVVYDIPGSVFPVKFEVDWVRCYRKK